MSQKRASAASLPNLCAKRENCRSEQRPATKFSLCREIKVVIPPFFLFGGVWIFQRQEASLNSELRWGKRKTKQSSEERLISLPPPFCFSDNQQTQRTHFCCLLKQSRIYSTPPPKQTTTCLCCRPLQFYCL